MFCNVCPSRFANRAIHRFQFPIQPTTPLSILPVIRRALPMSPRFKAYAFLSNAMLARLSYTASLPTNGWTLLTHVRKLLCYDICFCFVVLRFNLRTNLLVWCDIWWCHHISLWVEQALYRFNLNTAVQDGISKRLREKETLCLRAFLCQLL